MVFPTLNIEKKLWKKGFSNVCGIDEVGRGSFAGPVVAGAVIFYPNRPVPRGINDSKLLTAKKRERLAQQIKDAAKAWCVAEIAVYYINKLGIGKATQMAFRKCLKNISPKPDFVLIDAFDVRHFNRKKQKAIPKGDRVSISIAAASIIAKVHRDKLMDRLSEKYPQYGFSKHKGYGTKLHQDAIKKYGLSAVHRKSFNLQKFLLH